MNALILNRDFQLPTDGWFHVVPLGEFTHPSGVVQVIDAKAVASMVADFKNRAEQKNFPGLLVDFDHFSADPEKSSEAAGWINELENRADGIWAKIRWSDTGEAAVKSGRYRLASPVFPRAPVDLLNSGAEKKRLRVLRLLSVALTNDPNLKGMVPLSNRSDEFRRGAGALPAGNETTKQESKSMKSVCVLLGLSADANEESVHGAVTKLMNRATEAEAATVPLKNRVAEVEAENKGLLEAQVESDLETYAHCYDAAKKDETRTMLLKNRAVILGAWKAVPKPTKVSAGGGAQGNIHNRGTSVPGSVSGNTTDTREDEKKRADDAHAAVEEYRLQNRCSYEVAQENVRRKKPELFSLNRN